MILRSSSKTGTIKTTNPQSVTLAGTIQPFAGDTSSWPVINGVKQKRGWAVCEGAVLEQSTYPDLFANLGSTWNAFNHPSDGAPTVGGSQFALPNLKGLYLGGAGANGDSTFTLGSFAADLTGVNGLSNSSSSISGTSGASTVSWASTNITTNSDTHNHSISDPGHQHPMRSPSTQSGTNAGAVADSTAGGTFNWSSTYNARPATTGISINNDTHNHTFNKNLLNTNQNSHTHTLSGTASAQTVSGDAETRPKTAPVGYIIALYDNVATNALGLPEASASQSGTVTTGTQTFAGDKTFAGNTKVGNGTNLTPDALGNGHFMIDGSGYDGFISLDADGMWVGHNSGSRDLILATDETKRVEINATQANFNTSVRVKTPPNLWTGGDYYSLGDLGALYSAGSYRVSLTSNGYRNASNLWVSYGAGGSTGASEISLSPGGGIIFHVEGNKPSGSVASIAVVGTVSSTGAWANIAGGNWGTISDERLKDSVADLTNCLDTITDLRPVSYIWKDENANSNRPTINFIAQEVEAVNPSWVKVSGDETITVNGEEQVVADVKTLQLDTSFNAYLVGAIKELKAENDALKARIEALENLD